MGSEWEEVCLGELFKVKHGFAFKGEYFTDTPTKELLVTPGNFSTSGGFQNTKPKYYNGPIPEDYILNKDHIVVTMTDLSKQSDTLGFAANIPDDGNIWLHNQRVGLLEFKDNTKTFPKFFNYLLRDHVYRSWIIGSATGTTVKHTSPARIHSYSCKIPPLPEQKAIAHILGSLDDKIELNRQMNQTLESMAQALFKSWFVDFDPVIDNALAAGNVIPDVFAKRAEARTPSPPAPLPEVEGSNNNSPLPSGEGLGVRELFPSEFEYTEEMGWIPKGWGVESISTLGRVVTGKTPSKKVENAYSENGFPFITPTDVDDSLFVTATNRYLSKQGQLAVKKSIISSGTICVTCIGSQMGKTIIAPVDSFTNQQINSIEVYKPLYRNYLFLNLRRLKEEIFLMGSSGSTMPIINKSTFEKIEILIPDEELLTFFDARVRDLIKSVLANQIENQTLTNLRDTLLPKLLSGELRIPEAEKLVSEV